MREGRKEETGISERLFRGIISMHEDLKQEGVLLRRILEENPPQW